MKAIPQLLILCILFSSCLSIRTKEVAKSSKVNLEALERIPKNTSEILVVKQVAPDVLFEEVIRVLLEKSYRMVDVDKERLYLTTDARTVDGGNQQRMNLTIRNSGEESVLRIHTEWKRNEATVDATNERIIAIPVWLTARWTDNPGKFAMARSVEVAMAIENSTIVYQRHFR